MWSQHLPDRGCSGEGREEGLDQPSAEAGGRRQDQTDKAGDQRHERPEHEDKGQGYKQDIKMYFVKQGRNNCDD